MHILITLLEDQGGVPALRGRVGLERRWGGSPLRCGAGARRWRPLLPALAGRASSVAPHVVRQHLGHGVRQGAHAVGPEARLAPAADPGELIHGLLQTGLAGERGRRRRMARSAAPEPPSPRPYPVPPSPTWRKTSKGCPPPLRVMVVNIVHNGVGMQ